MECLAVPHCETWKHKNGEYEYICMSTYVSIVCILYEPKY